MLDVRQLFMRHAREIHRYLRRRGHSHDAAADLTQDTFVRVMAIDAGEDYANPRAYLHMIARNLSVDLLRRERTVPFITGCDEHMQAVADPAPTPETVVYDRQRLAIVEAAIAELPEKTRRAFELHRLAEMTIAEVGREVGLSTTRTWVLIRDAYRHLRRRLNESQV
ncbi:RNA polymerase sigma factor [Phreatobacter cathodiphilus]|uniref:RNA polymerase subunit sigma-24 n=1 Tax=Phreatobacter cathodiphilus TaxID=1868589 RepID=A0A2S0NGE0_9HYPH|nr:RNA polymerase sigma factor [Phreatobacter cathodiphilus]AVO47225.1 RNA polymerase subunit sigma-24 [Phreatobacter cathodiphilus]